MIDREAVMYEGYCVIQEKQSKKISLSKLCIHNRSKKCKFRLRIPWHNCNEIQVAHITVKCSCVRIRNRNAGMRYYGLGLF